MKYARELFRQQSLSAQTNFAASYLSKASKERSPKLWIKINLPCLYMLIRAKHNLYPLMQIQAFLKNNLSHQSMPTALEEVNYFQQYVFFVCCFIQSLTSLCLIFPFKANLPKLLGTKSAIADGGFYCLCWIRSSIPNKIVVDCRAYVNQYGSWCSLTREDNASSEWGADLPAVCSHHPSGSPRSQYQSGLRPD